jgi:hypothetical protein
MRHPVRPAQFGLSDRASRMIKASLTKNASLLILSGLCLLCIATGFQSADALQIWLRNGPFWPDAIKAAAMLTFSFATYFRLSRAIGASPVVA